MAITTKYPKTFPYPLLASYGYSVDMGVIRTPMESGNPRQRRRFRNMPHQFNFSFAIKITDLDMWQNWINANAFDWFEMDVVTHQTGATGACASPHYVRFISDLSFTALSNLYMGVSVNAELSMISAGAPIVDYGQWIIAGSPAEPSLDWIIGGTPIAPALNTTNPGTPAAPAVIV